MGGTLSSSSRNGQFFFDHRFQEWRWQWGSQWWTFRPLYDDDLDMGMFSRTGGCWVSDAGQYWIGPDPDEWMRPHRVRMDRRRRWIERQRRHREEIAHCELARKALERKMPAPLVRVALEHTFSWHAAQKM